MNSNHNSNTTLIQKCSEKGKGYLYLVLKVKPFSEKIVEELRAEVEKRLEVYLCKNIFPKLEKMDQGQFQDPEQSIKVIILLSIKEVLKEMMEENLLTLCPEDLALVDQILSGEEDKHTNEPKDKIEENENEEPKNKNKKKDDNINS